MLVTLEAPVVRALQAAAKSMNTSVFAPLAYATNYAAYLKMVQLGYLQEKKKKKKAMMMMMAWGDGKDVPKHRIPTSVTLNMRGMVRPEPLPPTDPRGVGSFVYQHSTAIDLAPLPTDVIDAEWKMSFWKEAEAFWTKVRKDVRTGLPIKMIRAIEIVSSLQRRKRMKSDKKKKNKEKNTESPAGADDLIHRMGVEMCALASVNNMGVLTTADIKPTGPFPGVQEIFWWAGGDRTRMGAWIELQAKTVGETVTDKVSNITPRYALFFSRRIGASARRIRCRVRRLGRVRSVRTPF